MSKHRCDCGAAHPGTYGPCSACGRWLYVTSDACPPDTLFIVPELQRQPGETDEAFRARVAAGTVKVRVGPAGPEGEPGT
jgi:hypothetical protein